MEESGVAGKSGYKVNSARFERGREDTVWVLGVLQIFLALLTETALDFFGLRHASRFCVRDSRKLPKWPIGKRDSMQSKVACFCREGLGKVVGIMWSSGGVENWKGWNPNDVPDIKYMIQSKAILGDFTKIITSDVNTPYRFSQIRRIVAVAVTASTSTRMSKSMSDYVCVTRLPSSLDSSECITDVPLYLLQGGRRLARVCDKTPAVYTAAGMDVAEDRLLFREGPADEDDAGAKSDEDLDEVLDDDVLSESAALRALRRVALRAGIITCHNVGFKQCINLLSQRTPQVVSDPFGRTLHKKNIFLIHKILFSVSMESLSPQVVFAAKLPILNPNEFDLWKMRIEQYFLMTDNSLWEVILNGDSPIPTRFINGVVQPVAPTTAEQRLARKNELKDRGTLLMALPDKHQLKLNIHKDANTLMEAIKKRFGGNKETKKVQKTLLKQQYENFTGSSSESLDQIHDRLQKLISQLEIMGDQSNSPQLDNDDLKQINADDLEEMDLKWQMAMLTMRARRIWHFARECRSPKDNRNKETQRRNVSAEEEPTNYPLTAFTSLSSSSFDNEVASCSKACTKAYATLHSYYDKLTNDLRKSQFDVLSYKTGLESVEARILVYQQNETVFEEDIKLLKLDVERRDNALVELRKKFEKTEQERDELKFKLENFQTSSKNLSQLLASQTSDKTGLGYDNKIFNSFVFDCDEMFSSESDVSMSASLVYDRYKSREGYHVVPPPYTGTFMPPKPNLVFHDAPTVNETVPTAFNVEPKDDSEGEPMPTQKASNFVQPTEHVETPRPSVKPVDHSILADNLRKDIPKSRGHRNSKNRKACFVCKSLTYLIKDCDYYEQKMVQKLVRNHAMRGNHHHYSRMTHPNPQRHVVPTAVLTRSRLVLLNAARPVNTAIPHTKVQHQRPTPHGVHKANSPKRRPINRRPSPSASNFHQKFTNAKAPRRFDLSFAKATLDESNLWHKRLGHINFKTMNKLVKDSLLPIPFWAEAVNTACYVQNKVLVTKPHNKTPYELLLGRTPSIGFMRPFGCPVTILNTLGPLGNQPNPSAGIQEHFDADKAGEGNVQQYILFPLWSSGSKDPHNTDDDVTFEVKNLSLKFMFLQAVVPRQRSMMTRLRERLKARVLSNCQHELEI
nr:ribonuclease H-like domain-containing protein [Tanacetum cinerariifolium]